MSKRACHSTPGLAAQYGDGTAVTGAEWLKRSAIVGMAVVMTSFA